MTAYILRRLLYAIPILIGVNIIVFAIFFYVNTPDDMARMHLGSKRITPEKIDQWKREHSLDLPYFYNGGWRRIGALEGRKKSNTRTLPTAGTGRYRLLVDGPQNKKLIKGRVLQVQCSEPDRLARDGGIDAAGKVHLPDDEIDRQTFHFRINAVDGEDTAAPTVSLNLDVASPASAHRVVLEYAGEIGFFSRFTQTIFFQRSMKMLFFQYGKSDKGKLIGDEILKRIGPSLTVTVPSFLMGIFLCIFFAMMSAFFRATYVDYWGVFLCVVGMSISMLFYIIGGQVVFGKILRLFPISGYDFGVASLKFVLLPILISVVAGLGGTVRFYRTIFLEEINRDYVRTARSKGLSESSVLFVHVLKNAMIPILTGVVVMLPFLYMGGLLLESFFAIPGTGSYLLDAIRSQDFAVVQALVSLGSFIYVVALAMTDVSYTLVDPRVRLE